MAGFIMSIIEKILTSIEAVNDWAGKTVMWSALALAVITAYDVAMRYIFARPTFWAYEIAWMLFSVHMVFGFVYGMRHNIHVRVEVVYNRYSPRVRAILEVVFYLAIILPIGLVLIKYGIDQAWFGWEIKRKSLHTAWGPPIYPSLTLIPIVFFLIVLQGFVEFVRNIKEIRRRKGGS